MSKDGIMTGFAEEAAARVTAWVKRHRARRKLVRMSDRLLADLGLERETLRERLAQAEAEVTAARVAARAARRAKTVRGGAAGDGVGGAAIHGAA